MPGCWDVSEGKAKEKIARAKVALKAQRGRKEESVFILT
jgi:hypothetical protein